MPGDMDRPSTSKARGVCTYYKTSRGCWAKDNCKFLHGEEEKLTPYDKSKTCRFYANGAYQLQFVLLPAVLIGHGCT